MSGKRKAPQDSDADAGADAAQGRSPKRARDREFEGRAVLVVGGAGGIGRAVVCAFAEQGATVVVADKEGVDKAVDDLKAAIPFPCSLSGVKCDVTQEHEVKAAVEAVVRLCGRLDHACNVAGVEGDKAPLAEASLANFDSVMAQMLEQTRGGSSAQPEGNRKLPLDAFDLSVVNIASTAGLDAMPDFSAYCASKHAVMGMSKCAAKEYVGKGIRVNCVCPSTTLTPMVERFASRWPEFQERMNQRFPGGRICHPEEVADCVLWLSSRRSRFVVGQGIPVEGGSS